MASDEEEEQQSDGDGINNEEGLSEGATYGYVEDGISDDNDLNLNDLNLDDTRETNVSNENPKKRRKVMSETTGKEKWHQAKELDPVDEAQMAFFKQAGNALAGEKERTKDSNDIFGEFIAAEIKLMPEMDQRMTRNEIQNVLFSAQMRSQFRQSQPGHVQPAYSTSTARGQTSVATPTAQGAAGSRYGMTGSVVSVGEQQYQEL